MKTHCYTTLFLTLFLALHGTGLLMCEDPKELPFEDRDPFMYKDRSDGNRYYRGLKAHGDYTKLKLIVRSRKTDYDPGERVWLKFFVRNDSDGEVHIQYWPTVYFCAPYWKLFHSNYDEAVKTPKLDELIQQHKRKGTYGFEWPGIGNGGHEYRKLQPGQEAELDRMRLNDFFDLSKPDTYELTCFTTSVIEGQEYQPPLQSNTLTFRVLEGTGTWQEKEEFSKVEYTNPPPGEEVFKQPKPPKNVFYLSNTTGETIDVSPYTYYRQRAKDAEAESAESPADAPSTPSE